MSDRVLLFRSVLFLVALFSLTLIWSIVSLFGLFLPYRSRYFLGTRWCRIVIWLTKTICGIHYQIVGYENLPDEPVILLSKHQSSWEPLFFCSIMPRPLTFVIKKELRYIPVFGWTLFLLRMISIDRTQGLKSFRQVIDQGKNRLSDGLWVVIFPEGTRTTSGEKTKYRGSGTHLAVEANAKIVPIALNSGTCWPHDSFIKRPGMITVSIGKPITPEGKSPDDLMHEVESWIESEMLNIASSSSTQNRSLAEIL